MKKKIIVLLAAAVLITAVLLSACSGEKPSNEGTSGYDEPQVSVTVSQEPTKTYQIFAIKGAVIEGFDPHTGEFSYFEKCESCGKISTEIYTGNKIPEGSDGYMSAFVCGNPDCNLHGSFQDVYIKQTVTEG
jgi:hypothetical protein